MKLYNYKKIIFFIPFLFFLLGMKPVQADHELKISVQENGIYRLSYSDLNDRGMADHDPRTFKIYNNGIEIKIYVYGEGDGIFDKSDYIEFYGTEINDKFTKTNIYWLTYGDSNGLRMSEDDGTIQGGAVIPKVFRNTLHMEQDSWYWLGVPKGKGKDHWFWGSKIIASQVQVKDYNFSVNNIAGSGIVTIRMKLFGRTGTPLNPDHHTKVYLNNSLVDDKFWDGQIEYFHNAGTSSAYLKEGLNKISLEQVKINKDSVESVHFNWFEIDYLDTFMAENNILEFNYETPGNYEFHIAGFTDDKVEIFDISNHASVSKIINMDITGTSPYTAKFEDTVQNKTNYIALTASEKKSPLKIEIDEDSDLKSTSKGADYIIITHEDFITASEKLKIFRENTGLRVKVVKINDVYDEFNNGIKNPKAIKDFLIYAYKNWLPPAPLYVLLMGDANLDHKDNYNKGRQDFIPTYMDDEQVGFGELPSDNWFAAVDGNDVLPDMFIGRIPVRSSLNAENVVDKIIAYESSAQENWNSNILFVADNNESEFVTASNNLASILPKEYVSKKVYMGNYNNRISQAQLDIRSALDKGALITSYIGHGSYGNWAGEFMFKTEDVASLNNSSRLTFVTVYNCLNGFFPHYESDFSLSEKFLVEDNKGAVAVWAPSGLGFTSEHARISEQLFTNIFKNGNNVIGSATTSAKVDAYVKYGISDDNINMFNLFGDPALKLKVIPSAPVSDFRGSPLVGDNPLTVNFEDMSTENVNSWLWDFGDGGTSNEQNPSYTFNNSGSYKVSLKVTGAGGTSTKERVDYISVSLPPVALVSDFTGTPLIGNNPLTVDFLDKSTGGIVSWLWDFGDGATSLELNTSHTYERVGTYTVSLTVSGPAGIDTRIETDFITVTVNNVNSPVADFLVSYIEGVPPLIVDFSDASTGIVDTWLWDFGDGTTSIDKDISKTYDKSGVYTVSLTVSGPGGSDVKIETDYITVTEPGVKPVETPTSAPPVENDSGGKSGGVCFITGSYR